MQERDGIEIQATMKSLTGFFEQFVIGNKEPTPQFMEYFLIHLQDLLQFASKQTTQSIEQMCVQIRTAQEKLRKEHTKNEFYPLAKEVLRLMQGLLAASSPMNTPFAIPSSRNPLFTGRDEILSQMKQMNRVALTGPGGIGKTELVLEYAFRYRDAYQAIFWVNASLGSDLWNVAASLHAQRQGRWLLILDQVNDLTLIDAVVPKEQHNGHILLTTRAIVPEYIAKSIAVPPFSDIEAALLFLREGGILGPGETLDQTSTTAQHDAINIARLLDGNPLALHLAGTQMKTMRINLVAYLRQTYRQREGMDMLKPLTHDQLSIGEHIVYFNDHADGLQISVGRIKQVQPYPWGEKVMADGFIILADVFLLEADDHDRLAHLFFRTYLYQKVVIPASGFFYGWPDTLPPQQFEKPKRRGQEKQIRLKLNTQRIVIVSSLDFDRDKNKEITK